MSTKIAWVQNPDGSPGETVNPITGCAPVSPGCLRCYAAGLASTRLAHLPAYMGLAAFGGWTGQVRWNPDALLKPLCRRKPTGYFVCDMGDLFHPSVKVEWIAAVWAMMALSPQHRFYILTKRPERMRAWFERVAKRADVGSSPWDVLLVALAKAIGTKEAERHFPEQTLAECEPWPLPNVYLGTTVEDQQRAEERIPHLLACPAAVRFLSVEPLLGAVDLTRWLADPCNCMVPADEGAGQHHHKCKSVTQPWGLDLVIVGGESGRGARPMHPDWARGIRDQCVAAGVPFYFKQWGEWAPFYDMDKDDPDCRRVPAQSDRVCRRNLAGGVGFHGDRVVYFLRMGARAGCVLDAQEWRQMPAVRS